MAVMKNRDARKWDEREKAEEICVTAEGVIRRRFQRSPYLPLRKICCYLRGDVLFLRGRVPTYYIKQLAQTIGCSFQGVREVSNDLQVDFPDRR